MDEQRLEEIASKVVAHFTPQGERIDAEDCFVVEGMLGDAIREALSSQEEELRKVREELRSMLRERRAAETASCQGYEAAVARAEAAEAEVLSLREQVKSAGKFADPEYRDAYISEASRDVLDACAAKQKAEDACERLALEVRSLREERDALDRKLTFNEIGARALQAQKEAADMRAESAEVEAKRLRERR